jgi:hypothetical protein
MSREFARARSFSPRPRLAGEGSDGMSDSDLLKATMGVIEFANHLGELLRLEREESARLRDRIAELELGRDLAAVPRVAEEGA